MDPHGKVFANDATARKAAEQLASHLAKNPFSEADRRVRVTDEAGEDIALIPVPGGSARK